MMHLIALMVTMMVLAADTMAMRTPVPSKEELHSDSDTSALAFGHPVLREMATEQLNELEDLIVSSASSNAPLSKNTFFIYNRAYPHAKLAQWGTGGRDVGIYEQGIYPDQLWYLDPSPVYSGYYYVKNAYRKGYRLAKWGSGDSQTGVYNGQYHDDQLWRFQKEGDYYRIYNKVYSRHKLAKWGKGDGAFGSYSGRNYNDQLWKLVPRYEATASEERVWRCDNRQGSVPCTETREYTVGMTMSISSTLSTRFGYESSITSSLSAGIGGLTASLGSSFTFRSEIEHCVTTSQERFWSEKVTRSFIAPAGKLYEVWQTVLKFSSPYVPDSCAFHVNELRIKESK